MTDTLVLVLAQAWPSIRIACQPYLTCELPGPIPQSVDWYLCVCIQVNVLANSYTVYELEIDVS